MTITDDLRKLLAILPEDLRQMLEKHPQRDSLVEVVLDLGSSPRSKIPEWSRISKRNTHYSATDR